MSKDVAPDPFKQRRVLRYREYPYLPTYTMTEAWLGKYILHPWLEFFIEAELDDVDFSTPTDSLKRHENLFPENFRVRGERLDRLGALIDGKKVDVTELTDPAAVWPKGKIEEEERY